MTDVDVVVAGGGLAGLAAMSEVISCGYTAHLIERASAPGGRARTVEIDKLPVETGAAFISDFYTEMLALVDRAGLRDKLVSRTQNAYTHVSKQTSPIWPAKLLLSSKALDWPSKARLLTLLVPLAWNWRHLDIKNLDKIVDGDDTSAAELSQRFLGDQATDRFFAPLLRGLLYWDIESTSAKVVLAILKAFLSSKATYRLDDGISSLTELLSANGRVQLSTEVIQVHWMPDGSFQTDFRQGESEGTIRSRGVICATPADAAGRILPWTSERVKSAIASVTYSSTVVATFEAAVSLDELPKGAILFPPSADNNLASVNPIYRDESNLESPQLFNVALSSKAGAEAVGLEDEELTRRLHEWLTEALGSDVAWIREARVKNIQRWPQAIPRFPSGHVAAMRGLKEEVAKVRAFRLAGDYIEAPYMDGAVRSGQEAARQVVAELNLRTS